MGDELILAPNDQVCDISASMGVLQRAAACCSVLQCVAACSVCIHRYSVSGGDEVMVAPNGQVRQVAELMGVAVAGAGATAVAVAGADAVAAAVAVAQCVRCLQVRVYSVYVGDEVMCAPNARC